MTANSNTGADVTVDGARRSMRESEEQQPDGSGLPHGGCPARSGAVNNGSMHGRTCVYSGNQLTDTERSTENESGRRAALPDT